MRVNEFGHVVNEDGSTTEPRQSNFWMGDNSSRVAFDFLTLDTGSVAIHALYGSVENGVIEDFMYEVVDVEDAWADAMSMFDEAQAFLTSEGVKTIMKVGLDNFILYKEFYTTKIV